MAVMRLYNKPLMPATRIMIILVIAVAGLFYVKRAVRNALEIVL
jgi:hypothetical protein